LGQGIVNNGIHHCVFMNALQYSKKNSKKMSIDALAKSLHNRHSPEGESPEVLEFPGFPFSRE